MNKGQIKDEIILIVKTAIGSSTLVNYGWADKSNEVDNVAEEIADDIYNAGYRKTFTSEIASDTQKAYKEGYLKGFNDGKEEFEIIKQRNAELIKERDAANAGIVNCSGCKLVELNAVKEFAEKLRKRLNNDSFWINDLAYNSITESIDELLKEYEK